MAGGSGIVRPGESRVSTGNASLDMMLEGGLVARRPYLIVGPSGTGKTTLAIQFLCEGVKRRERVLLVTLEEPPNEARINHRGLEPELNAVEVFDAIPDIMRYERAPFKDISAVRSAVPFREVPWRIRRSPELASVEVTITALEQMLRTEIIRKGYTRLVVDSLTALQYFCMKGFDPVAGAQSFLRFLSDLHVTTLLTVEAPLEDVETPERMLARGEIRLFRWELDGQTVRAIGVEKFRGSSHDVRLHPYRIGPKGIDINLEVTISRDTRQIIEPLIPHLRPTAAVAPAVPTVSPVTPLVEEVRDLILLGADVEPARTEIEAALEAATAGRPDEVQAHLSRVSSLLTGLVEQLSHAPRGTGADEHASPAAFQRVLARVETFRTGVPPMNLPPQQVLEVQLGALLSLLPPGAVVPPVAEPVTAPEVSAPPAAPSPPKPEAAPAAPPGPPPPPPPSAEPVAPPAEVSTPVVAPIPPPPPAAPEASPAAPAPVDAPPAPPPPVVAHVMEVPPSPSASIPSAPAAFPPKETEPHAGRGSRAGGAKGLPPPPKPRPAVAGAPKPAAAPSARVAAPTAAPPPLPTGAPSGWEPAVSRSAPAAVPPAPRAAQGPSIPSPVAPAPAPTVAKRRRRAAPAAAAKKATPHPRASPAHPAHEAPSQPVHPTPAHPAATSPPEGSPGPTPSSPAVEGPTAEAPPKPRRRAPRKRKAPPVVSATVEPIPPGVFGAPDADSSTSDPSDDLPPPEV